jgi:hypothetical protein
MTKRPDTAPKAVAMSLARMRQLALIGMGWTIIAAGVVIAPLPGPFGLPVALVGVVMLLRNSADARRLFVRLRRRKPHWFKLFDRHIRRRERPPKPDA